MRKLYKYTKVNNALLRNLENNQVYFSNAKYFNDPFDSWLNAAFLKKDGLQRNRDGTHVNPLVERINQRFQGWKEYWITNSKYYRSEFYWEYYNKFFRSEGHDDIHVETLIPAIIIQETSVFCASQCKNKLEDANLILMLSHYGDSHKGVILEYEYDDANSSDEFISVKVDYNKEKLTQDDIHRMIGAIVDDMNFSNGEIKFNKMDSLQEFYKYKHAAWEYENEFRILCGRPQGAVSADDAGLTLKAIHFGIGCPKFIKDRVVNITSIRESVELNDFDVNADNKYKLEITNLNKDRGTMYEMRKEAATRSIREAGEKMMDYLEYLRTNKNK